MSIRRTVSLPVLLLVATACISTSSSAPPTPSVAFSPAVTPDPLPIGRLGDVRVRLVPVATLDQPVAMALRAGDPDLYVAEKVGRVVLLRDGKVGATVLDVTDRVSQGSEQGLLGLAFSPDGRFLYVNLTDVNGDTRVEAYRMRGHVADPASERDILFVDQPFSNHNGGDLVFGPDGYLYIGLGDGGSGGDPFGNGQSLTTLLGKMLRIAPTPGGSAPYAIPPDNPFVDRSGARPEIWAYGLRNPWRYSFDRETGDLWIGDVGQNAWEEIDRQPAGTPGGRNYGWNALEGTHPYQGTAPPDAVPPVYEYPHATGGCAVTGGYVYRGSAIPDLVGGYVFADFCLGRIKAMRLRPGQDPQVVDLGVTEPSLASFGQDDAGELYVLSLAGGLSRLAPG
jgi:glucose/arabinose dehydrogenase